METVIICTRFITKTKKKQMFYEGLRVGDIDIFHSSRKPFPAGEKKLFLLIWTKFAEDF